MTKIDATDEKIIDFLLSEGQATNHTIAEALETSEATVRRRRTRLEEAGVIKMVCAADPAKLGFHAVAIIGIKARPDSIISIESTLKQLDDVQFLGLTTGGYDLMLEVWLRSPDQDITTFTTDIIGRIDGIISSDVFLLNRLSKYSGWSGFFQR